MEFRWLSGKEGSSKVIALAGCPGRKCAVSQSDRSGYVSFPNDQYVEPWSLSQTVQQKLNEAHPKLAQNTRRERFVRGRQERPEPNISILLKILVDALFLGLEPRTR